MTIPTRLALTLIYLAFQAVSVWALWELGYFGILRAAVEGGPGMLQILFDLIVACAFGARWLHNDARLRGIPSWPWLLAVLPFGSIPIFTYLLARDYLGHAPVQPDEAPQPSPAS